MKFYDSTALKSELPEKKQGSGLLKKVGLFAALLVIFGAVLYLGQDRFGLRRDANMMIQQEQDGMVMAAEMEMEMQMEDGDDLEIVPNGAGSFKLCNKGAFSVEAIKCFEGTSSWNELVDSVGGIYHLTNPFCKTVNFKSEWIGRNDITCRAYIVAACPGNAYKQWTSLAGGTSHSACISGTTCFLGTSCGGGGSCFGVDEMVTVRSSEDGTISNKKISQVEVGDDVLSYDLEQKTEKFDKVLLRSHYHDFDEADEQSDLIRLHAENNHSIELSGSHLLYVGRENPVLKNVLSIEIGDSVWFKDQPVRIISKQETNGPFRSIVTKSGNILVNQFVASSHTGRDGFDHIMQQKVVTYFDYVLAPIFDHFSDPVTKDIAYAHIRRFVYGYVVKSIKDYHLSSAVVTVFSIITTSVLCFATFGFFSHLSTNKKST